MDTERSKPNDQREADESRPVLAQKLRCTPGHVCNCVKNLSQT